MRTVTRDSLRGSRDFRAVADAFLALITSNAGRISAVASVQGDATTSSYWTKPQRPTWMDEATYATIPATLALREIRFSITVRIHAEPGRRTKISPVRL